MSNICYIIVATAYYITNRVKSTIHCRKSLEFFDLLPEDPKLYDKMRPPKKDGQATIVYFHVTVMGLDSIDETSMVGSSYILQSI